MNDRAQLTAPASLERIPRSLVPAYRRLVVVGGGGARGTGKRRCSVAQFIRLCSDTNRGGFFVNEYVNTLLFLQEIQLKDAKVGGGRGSFD